MVNCVCVNNYPEEAAPANKSMDVHRILSDPTLKSWSHGPLGGIPNKIIALPNTSPKNKLLM